MKKEKGRVQRLDLGKAKTSKTGCPERVETADMRHGYGLTRGEVYCLAENLVNSLANVIDYDHE